MGSYTTIEWVDGVVRMLDQRQLPQQIKYLEYSDAQGVAMAIREMVIRGAPAIGAAAGYGLALAAVHSTAKDPGSLQEEIIRAAEVLRASRPTAHDLFWAVERILKRVNETGSDNLEAIKTAVLEEAQSIAMGNAQINRQIGLNALPLIPNPARIIHHCNTGALATVDYGTALGVVRAAHEHGKQVFVYVDETRPRLQGARLTSWELQQLGIPHSVIVDSASGYVMRTQGVDLCLVGCDRIAANGDTANKVGTYNLALVAWAHGVPFYVVGPTSTIDMSIASGDEIQIEERSEREITHIGETQITPEGVQVLNPAFDVTPAKYITAIITERGIAYPPYNESLVQLMSAENTLWECYNLPMPTSLTHLDDSGHAHMVDVGQKPDTERIAIAKGEVRMKMETLALIEAGSMKKGDVLTVAQLAGIMAAKRTSELIPLCHPLSLTQVEVVLEPDSNLPGVIITATVHTVGKTGVEMEALTAVSVAALTVYDMAKAVEKTMCIQNIRLVEKHGGRSGDVVNE